MSKEEKMKQYWIKLVARYSISFGYTKKVSDKRLRKLIEESKTDKAKEAYLKSIIEKLGMVRHE